MSPIKANILLYIVGLIGFVMFLFLTCKYNLSDRKFNTFNIIQVSVHSPYIGRWSPFYHIKPLPDYSDAPTDLVVKVIKPFHVAQVCWVSTYLDTQPLLVIYFLFKLDFCLKSETDLRKYILNNCV